MAKKLTTKLLGKVAIDSGLILIQQGRISASGKITENYQKQIDETIIKGGSQIVNEKGVGVAVVTYSAKDGMKDVYGVFEGNLLKEIKISIF